LHNFIQQDKELAKLNKRHEFSHEDDTMWRHGLSANGEMPDLVEFGMVSHVQDIDGPGRGVRSDLESGRRVHITRLMKEHGCERPKGSKEAQEIRYKRAACELTCA
jgi:hypothetical protein